MAQVSAVPSPPASLPPSHAAVPRARAALPVLLPALALALTFAVIAGLGEVAWSVYVAQVQHRISHQTPQAVWMAPTLNALLFLVPALALALVGRRGVRWWFPALLGTLAGLAAFALLRLVPGLADWARLALAAGLGARLGAFGRRREPAVRRVLPAVAGALVALTAALGIGYNVVRGVRERHALATLPAAASGAPNVLLVVWDAVRAQSLSLYGAPRPTSPDLQRLAAAGLVFDRAISTSPWTLPSHASLFTGHYADRLSAGWLTPLDGRDPTLAEVLDRHGYATAGFVGNVFYTAAATGLDRGMAHYEDYGFRPGDFFLSAALGRFLAYNRVRQGLGYIQVPARKSAADIDAEVLRWLDRRPAGHPFFAFLNVYDAHAPYLPPRPYDTLFVPRSERGAVPPGGDWKATPAGIREQHDLYDGAIAYVDAQLGRLLDGLRARHLLENTIVVVVADHGEEWAEHPRIFGHGNSLYIASLHVPLVVVAPGRVPAGVRVATPVTTRDVAATILDLAGIERSPLAGASLARYWRASATAPAEEAPLRAEVGKATNVASIYPVSVGDLHSVFAGGYQLIVNGDGREELYDLRRDAAEQHDLLARPLARADDPRRAAPTSGPRPLAASTR